MAGASRGARVCTLRLDPDWLAGLVETFPFLPHDATAVALLVHSNSYELVRRGACPDARAQARTVRRSDQAWPDSPVPGPDCLCSRCRRPILQECPVRLYLHEGPWEYRFHGECVGLLDAPPLER